MDLLYESSDDDEDTNRPPIVGAFPKPKHSTDETSATMGPTRAPGKRILSLAAVLPAHILEALTKHPGNEDDHSSSSDDDDGESVVPASQDPPVIATKPWPSAAASSTEFSSFLKELHKVGFANENDSNHGAQKNGSHVRGVTPLTVNADSEGKKSFGNDLVTHVTTTISRKNKDSSSHLVRDIHNEGALPAAMEETGTQAGLPSASAIPAPILAAPTRSIKIHAAPQVSMIRRENNETIPTESSTTLSSSSASSSQDVPGQELPSDTRPWTRKQIEQTLRRNTGGTVNIESLWNETGLTQTQQGVDPNLYAPNALPRKAPAPPSGLRNVPTHLYDPSTGTTVAHDPQSGGIGKGRGKNQINHLLAQAVRLERERAEQDQVTTGVKMHRANAKRKYGW
jgi:hypothetical protein